ncbi:MAG: hypothetical protein H6772_03820 [Pseudomonadales bacterium]|nr:hypothetical protein [Pseudomonadales bacterium]
MSTAKHTALLLSSVLMAYLWLTTPFLNNFALQAFSLSTLGYFLVKKINNAKLWHILPKNYSLEMMFITFSILILVGSTGNIESVFYPFVYIHLFILVMSTKETTSIAVAMSTLLFHYAISPSFSISEIATILTTPIMLILFLFARKQYNDAQISHSIIQKEEIEINNLTRSEHSLESFISSFLKPKLIALEDLESKNEKEIETIKSQISLILSESDKILEKIKENETLDKTES